ncbi:Transposase DDE domain protein [compost metagenome]
MGNIPKDQVICKCLDLLNLSDERDKTLDFRTQKLTVSRLVKLMIEAELRQHSSYSVITEHLRSSDSFQQHLNLTSISESQISRKLRAIPYTYCQLLFLKVTERLQCLTKDHKGLPELGRLHIMDSTELTLPSVAGQWAYCSKTKNAVKMHTRLVVADSTTVFPDRIIASTADVADSEVVMEMVVDDDAIYVMDRGYIAYRNYQAWTEQNRRFVARIQKRNRTELLRERPVPPNSKVSRDADVKVSYTEQGQKVDIELRLVEFSDDKDNFYRVLTNVDELSAEQISEIYHHRWMIELFFKWIKQHLKLVKLYSLDPEAIWTQMYLA